MAKCYHCEAEVSRRGYCSMRCAKADERGDPLSMVRNERGELVAQEKPSRPNEPLSATVPPNEWLICKCNYMAKPNEVCTKCGTFNERKVKSEDLTIARDKAAEKFATKDVWRSKNMESETYAGTVVDPDLRDGFIAGADWMLKRIKGER